MSEMGGPLTGRSWEEGRAGKEHMLDGGMSKRLDFSRRVAKEEAEATGHGGLRSNHAGLMEG